jgi:FkbM family methyltransferase
MIASSIQGILTRFGYRLQRVPRSRITGARFTGDEVAFGVQYDVDTIIDVGVAGGTPWLYDAFPTQNLLLVEPLNVVESLNRLLVGRNYELVECAVGLSEGTTEIHYDRTIPSRSSIQERTELTATPEHDIVRKTVEIRTLDRVVAESRFRDSASFGLKIDTEGFELDVLKGAPSTLARCRFAVCEVSVEERFENSYTFSELIVFMHSQGFGVRKLLSAQPDRHGVIRFADMLFEPEPAR